MSDDFTKKRFLWLDQVAEDASLPPSSARVAIILCRYFSRVEGYAWPSIDRIAEHLTLSKNAVRSTLHSMERAGHLTIERRGGRRRSNRYRYLLMSAKPSSHLECLAEEMPENSKQSLKQDGVKGTSQLEGNPLTETAEKKKKGPVQERGDDVRHHAGRTDHLVRVKW